MESMHGIKRPAFIILVLLISGRILGTFLPLYSWIILSALLFLILFQMNLVIRRNKIHTPPPSGYLLFLAVIFIGMYQQLNLQENDRYIRNAVENLSELSSITINARVKSEFEERDNSLRMVIDDLEIVSGDRSTPLNTQALVYLYRDAAQKMKSRDPAPGDLIRIESRALVPRSLKNPTLFNYRAFLAQRGVHVIFRLSFAREFEMSLPGGKRSFKNRIFHAIHNIRMECERNFDRVLTPRDAALIEGLCLGSSLDMSPEDREIFLNTGLIHLFSVSGLHTCMIALLLFYILRILGLRFTLVSFLTIGGIWFFAILTDLRIPVVRSAVMITCILGSHFLPGRKRPIEGISALSFVAFWALVFNPRALFQPDFLLSYLSVFAIFIFLPFFKTHFLFQPANTRISSRHFLVFLNRYVLIPIFTVLSVQIVLFPILAHYYHRFSLISLIAGPVVIPVAFIALIFGIFHSVLEMTIPAFAPSTAWIIAQLIHILRGLADFFSQIPFSAIPVKPLTWFGMGIYYACLLGGNWILEKKEWKPDRAIRFSIVFLLLTAFLIWLPLLGTPGYELEVIFLDVGQGDAIYMEFPDGGNLLIDGGANAPRNMGKEVIAPFLENRGRDSIDAIILTHPDADHLGGLPFILDNFFVDHVFEGDNKDSSELYREWDKKIRYWGIERKRVSRGDRIEGFEDAEVSILNPPNPYPQEWNQNDRSVVVRIKKDGVIFLFTGDASSAAEVSMIQSGMDLKADIQKIGHHGSRDASEELFIRSVHPRISVISAGEGNRHGHPHKEVLERLSKYSEKIYRTDRHGAVTIRIKDGKILVECQNP
jgi:competence protein ComEC